jgi:hypothetical protein
VFCFEDIESASHLFASCNKTKEIWDLIFTWLDWKAVGWGADLVDNFLLFNFNLQREERQESVPLRLATNDLVYLVGKE